MKICLRLLFLLPISFSISCNIATTDSNLAERQLDLSTPGKTLTTLASVWTDYREIDNYSALLTDDYRFYFDPNDVGSMTPGGYQIPEYWTRAEDIQVTGNMFAQAYDIRLEVLNAADFDEPNIPGDFYRADNVLIQFYL